MTRFRLTLFAVILAAVLWLDPIWAPLVPVGLFMPVFAANCTIFEDDFSTDRTGTDYTVVSGTWSVGSGVITTTSSGALIVENTVGTNGHGHAAVRAKASSFGSTLRLVGSYVNSSIYLYAELTINGVSSTLKLWDKATSTQIGSTRTFTAAVDTFYTLRVCWDGTVGVASIEEFNVATFGSYTGTGDYCGLGATPAGGGTATFDNLSLSTHSSDNNACANCTEQNYRTCATDICVDDLAPKYLLLEISGAVNDDCNQCTAVNGSFVLSESVDSFSPECTAPFTTPDYCIWRFVISNDDLCEQSGASNIGVYAAIYINDDGDKRLQVQVRSPFTTAPDYTGGFITYKWDTLLSDGEENIDCFEYLDFVELNYLCLITSSLASPCDMGGAVVTISIP